MSEINVMIDIETLGTKPGCVVCSIGAVAWQWEDPLFCVDAFSTQISISSCLERGLQIEAETLSWWMNQGEEARGRALFGTTDLDDALIQLAIFIQHSKFRDRDRRDPVIWAKGPAFDVSILEECYRRVRARSPWNFRRVRDVRTFLAAAEVVGFVEPRRGPDLLKHDAVADAKHQALVVRGAHAALVLARNARTSEQTGVQC